MDSDKWETLIFFNGIAIFFIVIYHELGGFTTNPLYFIEPYLESLGLTLFTFSAGYKLFYNHHEELNQKPFLGEYFLKRFIRLYKPYLGYSLLIFIPLLIVTYVTVYIFHFNFDRATTFINLTSNMSSLNLIEFLLGNNPITSHLWYLVALIGITSICFSILYFKSIHWLFYLFIPFLLLSLWIRLNDVGAGHVDRIIMFYLPFFIFGIYYSYSEQNQKNNWFKTTKFYSPLFFLIVFILAIILRDNAMVHTTLLIVICFLFPFFLFAIFNYVKKVRFVSHFLIFCGVYSFQIYLFHVPLCLPILSRFITGIMKINYVFMPLLISIFGIYFSVFTYKVIKKIHLNILFE
jgi:peptidoglycan/LPS O-acetylase OafA/YrhL